MYIIFGSVHNFWFLQYFSCTFYELAYQFAWYATKNGCLSYREKISYRTQALLCYTIFGSIRRLVPWRFPVVPFELFIELSERAIMKVDIEARRRQLKLGN